MLFKMVHASSLVGIVATSLSLITPALASYDVTAKNNIVLYYVSIYSVIKS